MTHRYFYHQINLILYLRRDDMSSDFSDDRIDSIILDYINSIDKNIEYVETVRINKYTNIVTLLMKNI